jgi:uncharacterized protein
MFPRDIIRRLDRWAEASDRKPLILRGARQVGKTVAVDLFGERFDHYISLNLEIEAEREIFKRGLSIPDLFQAILLRKKIVPRGGRVLLFLDEVQNSPEAVAGLRYFYEQLPHIHVIAAGSLLEVYLANNRISFPVGRVRHLFMYPLSFREFLLATGNEQAVEALETAPLPDWAISPLFELFHRYTLIGGMPEIVANYSRTGDIPALKPIYDSLLVSYLDDVAKYGRNRTISAVIKHCIESAPFNAGRRITFAGFGKSNYRSREVGEALRTLERAMLIRLLRPSTSVEIPIVPNFRKSPRLQFLDTGLLNYFVGLQDQYFKYDNLHSIHKGLITEHIVGQELICREINTRKKLCFWVREERQSKAEVDFLLQYQDYAVPVETKSGKTGSLRSLHQFMDRCPHHFAARLYSGPPRVEQAVTPAGKSFRLLNLPYFLASQIPRYLDRMMG